MLQNYITPIENLQLMQSEFMQVITVFFRRFLYPLQNETRVMLGLGEDLKQIEIHCAAVVT
jgi:hypothetical protein